ncbi:MAG: DUF58 domain-containing protein [Verrucomicrobia bacterium]|nr:DUF58 domain-containing protein [Verrucomicrobiota bacterium]
MNWILGTLALLLAGLLLKLSLLVYAMYVLLGVLGLCRFFTRTWIDRLDATRFCATDIVEIDEIASVQVEVVNRGPLAVPWLILEDSLPRDALLQVPPRIQAEGARLRLTRLERGESQSLSYQVSFLMRGYYQLGPLLLETGDVFGLHRRFRIAADPHFVMVLPKVLPLRGYNLSSRRPIGEIRLTHRLFEDPTRIAGIRAYQHGDPLNRIHWRATARTGQLHSRLYESSCVAGATFLLDFHQDSYQGNGASASAELAVTTVASLANAVYLMGQQIGFITNGLDAADRIRAEGWRAEFTTRSDAQQRARQESPSDRLRPVVVGTGRGIGPFNRILQALARLELGRGLEFAALVDEAAWEIPRDTTVVVVLRQVTPATAIALGDLVQRGFAVTTLVIAFDETVAPDWARPPEWAEMLLAEGVDFRMVNTEEMVMQLCAEAILR